MIIHSYEKKILVKIPPASSNHKIIEEKLGVFLEYNLGKKIKKIDLNFANNFNIDCNSICMKISPEKLEIYRNQKKKIQK